VIINTSSLCLVEKDKEMINQEKLERNFTSQNGLLLQVKTIAQNLFKTIIPMSLEDI